MKSPARETIDSAINSIVISIKSPEIPDRTIDLIDFSGHQPDRAGSYDFYSAIQKAIDELATTGGGTLHFRHTKPIHDWAKTTEIYRIRGPIFLKSCTGILIDPNIKIFFEFDPESYLENSSGVITRYEGTTIYSFSPLIRALDAHDISIRANIGSGAMPVIDGDGENWQIWAMEGQKKMISSSKKPAYMQLKEINNSATPLDERIFNNTQEHHIRPSFFEPYLCDRVLLENIKLVNAPFWVVHPVFCQDVTFRGLQFDCENVNNDGIDPDSCRRVLIENIVFKNHDDNIAIKAGRDREAREGLNAKGSLLEHSKSVFNNNGIINGKSEKIVIRNCSFKGHYAICFGSEVGSGASEVYAVDNIAFQDIKMAIFLKSSRSRGGVVENIFIDNFYAHNVDEQVICLLPNYDNDSTSPFPPTFKNIQISNLYVKQAGKGILIHGWPDAPVENVTITDLTIDNLIAKNRDLIISESKSILLCNVKINGVSKDGNFTVSKGDAPPQVI